MISFTIRRILQIIPMLLLLTFLVFTGLELMPGDAVSYMVGPDALAGMDPAALEQLRQSLGLNDPFFVRYGRWLLGIFQGEFGYSVTSGTSVWTLIAPRLVATLELSAAALLFSTVFGIVLGIISALRKGSTVDNGLTLMGMAGLSIPDFFFGLVLIVVFGLNLGWLPVSGRIGPTDVHWWDHLDHLILPALALGIAMTAGVMRYSRSSMLDAQSKAFMTTARSKGMSPLRMNLVHGFRVAVTPVVVLIGFRLPTLISGTVVIEQIFQWPGIGSQFLAAVRGQDFPVIMMIALLSTAAMLFASLIVDLLTAIIDPRVRLS